MNRVIDSLATSRSLVETIRAGFDLLHALDAGNWQIGRDLVARAEYNNDFLYRAFALLALGRLGTPDGVAEIIRAGSDRDSSLHSYAAWALEGRADSPEAALLLVRLLQSSQGLTRMLAQKALRGISGQGSVAVLAARELFTVATGEATNEARAAALSCLGYFSQARRWLPVFGRIAKDPKEADSVRAVATRTVGMLGNQLGDTLLLNLALDASDTATGHAAIACLADIADDRARFALLEIDRSDPAGPVGDSARLALSLRRRKTRERDASLTLAQIVMQGSVDTQLTSSGAGDVGGLATLTVELAAAFAANPDIGRVYTVGQAGRGERLREQLSDGSSLVLRLPFAPGDVVPAADLWQHALDIEHCLDRALCADGGVDALHLRFADAGTLAAARWAHAHGVPVHFTLAPDPYVPIETLQSAGRLNRQSFAQADRQEHYVFRTSILEWMVRRASGLALLPRADWAGDGYKYFGFDVQSDSRASVIAEGIRLAGVRDVRQHAGPRARSTAEILMQARSPLYGHGLAPIRRDLPVLVSVARMHPVKGLVELVEAWASNEAIGGSCNLILVGGNLDFPNSVEQEIFDQIEAMLIRFPNCIGGLLLLGNQPNAQVRSLLAALQVGVTDITAPRAIAVCASRKEEFGLSILEAMAAQLVVIAPNVGGPATYLADGTAGFLFTPSIAGSLANALRRAMLLWYDAAAWNEMAERLKHTVESRFSVERMAADLVSLYQQESMQTAIAS